MTTMAESGADAASPTAGVIRLRVRYSECDPMGVAHHGSYAAWLELGRTGLLRDAGRSYAQMEADGVFLVITKMELRYRRPIRYDDVIEVRTRVAGVSPVRLRHAYEVVLVERGDADPSRPVPADGVLAVGSTELACVDGDGRPRALPEGCC
jgi:acyl-CoA thioester hydrolase